MHALETRIPPPLLLALVALWMGWVSAPGTLGAPGWRALAVALGLLGAAINVAGFRRLRKAGSTIDPTRPDAASVLVTSGVFARSRNPMYVGFTLLLLAWAAWRGSTGALIGPVVYVAWLHRFQILPEERALRARFGTPYAEYCLRVRRWL